MSEVEGLIQIRPVRPEEHEAAGNVVLEAYTSLPGGHISGGYADVLTDVARRAREAVVLVAAVSDRVIGCVTFVTDHLSPWAELVEPGESAIRMLAVLPTGQGAGVGRLLVTDCIDLARQHGSSALFLHSTPWMDSAHRLYRRLGFVRVPERDWLPEPEVPLLGFRLDLTHG